MHRAESSTTHPIFIEAEIAVETLKRYKYPDIDQIPANLIQAGGII
jgi:hypothetical protein